MNTTLMKNERGLAIPRRETMVLTHGDDPLEWYYKPVVRKFYLHRFKMILDLLRRSGRTSAQGKVLEVGFGSGFLLPSLQSYFKEVHGADVHPKVEAVEQRLKDKHQVATQLSTASVYDLPYENDSFDCVIGVSLLEQLEELDRAILEMCRVAKKQGDVILGFPTKNALMHVLFRLLLRGRSDDDFHVSTHWDILEAIRRHLNVEEIRVMPTGVPIGMAMYVVCRGRRK